MYKIELNERAIIAILVLVLIALLVSIYFLTYLIFRDKTDISLMAREVDSIVFSSLVDSNINLPDIRKNYIPKQNGKHAWEQIEVAIMLDETQSIAGFRKMFKDALNLSSLTIKEDRRNIDASLSELQFSVCFEDMPIYQLLIRQKHLQKQLVSIPEETPARVIPKEKSFKIALIVDDMGYDVENAVELLELRQPMTIAILPHLTYSRHIAELANDMGYEIMMHLPMDSGKRLRHSPGFITPYMDEEELLWVLERDFSSIPFVVGVNNHQGSLMTRDEEAMARVMKYLAKRDVFFVDSRTTSESVAYDVARKQGLRTAKNKVFLDNEKDVEYIKERIEILMQEARQQGEAIGICHLHPSTVEALQQMLPVIEKSGIELVFASELVN